MGQYRLPSQDEEVVNTTSQGPQDDLPFEEQWKHRTESSGSIGQVRDHPNQQSRPQAERKSSVNGSKALSDNELTTTADLVNPENDRRAPEVELSNHGDVAKAFDASGPTAEFDASLPMTTASVSNSNGTDTNTSPAGTKTATTGTNESPSSLEPNVIKDITAPEPVTREQPITPHAEDISACIEEEDKTGSNIGADHTIAVNDDRKMTVEGQRPSEQAMEDEFVSQSDSDDYPGEEVGIIAGTASDLEDELLKEEPRWQERKNPNSDKSERLIGQGEKEARRAASLGLGVDDEEEFTGIGEQNPFEREDSTGSLVDQVDEVVVEEAGRAVVRDVSTTTAGENVAVSTSEEEVAGKRELDEGVAQGTSDAAMREKTSTGLDEATSTPASVASSVKGVALDADKVVEQGKGLGKDEGEVASGKDHGQAVGPVHPADAQPPARSAVDTSVKPSPRAKGKRPAEDGAGPAAKGAKKKAKVVGQEPRKDPMRRTRAASGKK